MCRLSIIICQGINNPALTEKFVACLNDKITGSLISDDYVNLLIAPADGILPLSGVHIHEFLRQSLKNNLESPVVFIGFSAGVVGAIAAAHLWQLQSGKVEAFIAIDGWGVPLFGDFPIYRMSHDYFTHWSSLLLGSGQYNFYADPSVEHLQMWENPQTVEGWLVDSRINPPSQQQIGAIEFLYKVILKNYLVEWASLPVQ